MGSGAALGATRLIKEQVIAIAAKFLEAAEEPTVAHPRTLIVAGENSQAAIIETYLSLDDGPSFTNAVTEAVIGENAVLALP